MAYLLRNHLTAPTHAKQRNFYPAPSKPCTVSKNKSCAMQMVYWILVLFVDSVSIQYALHIGGMLRLHTFMVNGVIYRYHAYCIPINTGIIFRYHTFSGVISKLDTIQYIVPVYYTCGY